MASLVPPAATYRSLIHLIHLVINVSAALPEIDRLIGDLTDAFF